MNKVAVICSYLSVKWGSFFGNYLSERVIELKKRIIMLITVHLLENQKLEACFNNYSVPCDQPLDNKGEATAPSPFDYFLASSAHCAGYFVKAYCASRNISIEGITIVQNNTKNSENKYKHIFEIKAHVPAHFTQKDREGILRSI